MIKTIMSINYPSNNIIIYSHYKYKLTMLSRYIPIIKCHYCNGIRFSYLSIKKCKNIITCWYKEKEITGKHLIRLANKWLYKCNYCNRRYITKRKDYNKCDICIYKDKYYTSIKCYICNKYIKDEVFNINWKGCIREKYIRGNADDYNYYTYTEKYCDLCYYNYVQKHIIKKGKFNWDIDIIKERISNVKPTKPTKIKGKQEIKRIKIYKYKTYMVNNPYICLNYNCKGKKTIKRIVIGYGFFIFRICNGIHSINDCKYGYYCKEKKISCMKIHPLGSTIKCLYNIKCNNKLICKFKHTDKEKEKWYNDKKYIIKLTNKLKKEHNWFIYMMC